MKNCLLTLAVAALAIAGPAYSQHAYLDVNGDGLNYDKELQNGNPGFVPVDFLDATVTSIDVWFSTNEMADGSAAVCDENPASNLTLGSYEAVLRYTGSGTVTFTGWTDNLGFPFGLITEGDNTFYSAGTDAWFARGSDPPGLPPGTYKVGTIAVTVTGTPGVFFAVDSPLGGNAQTSFGSQCEGARFDNTLRLGPQGHPDYDWYQSFGTAAPTPVVKSTWGKIKTLYH